MSTPEFKEPNVSDEPVDSTDTMEDATAKGFLGQVFDLNPDESYTVAAAGARQGASAPAAKSSSSSSKSSSSSSS